MNNEHKQFKRVKAVFKPHPDHMDTLKSEVKPLIGKTYTFYYMWIADEGEMFEGTWMLSVVPESKGWLDWVDIGVVAIPELDLEIIEEVPR